MRLQSLPLLMAMLLCQPALAEVKQSAADGALMEHHFQIAATPADAPPRDFIREIVATHVAEKRYDTIVTRFPPEPNGYLHLGHARSICLNLGLARENGGRCHLRMDDTNPAKEDATFVQSIIADIRWLIAGWAEAQLAHKPAGAVPALTTAATAPGVSSQTVKASITRRFSRIFLIPSTKAVERIWPRCKYNTRSANSTKPATAMMSSTTIIGPPCASRLNLKSPMSRRV